MSNLQSQIDRLHRRIRMILAPAVIKTTDDTGSLLKGQININGTPEVIDPIGIMYAYGFHANPLPNTDATALFLAGDRSNPIIVATNHQQSRPRNYKPGEIGIYTDEGDTVTLNRDNQLNINSKKQVTVKGKDKVALDTPLTEISKDVKAFGKIDASEGFFKNGVAMGGAGAPGAAGPPGPQGPQGPPGATGPAGTYQAGYGIAINTGTAPPTISTAVPYLPLTGGTINGPLTIANDQGSGYGGQFAMYNAAAGATNPAKYFRVSPTGTIEIINNAFSAAVFQFTDSGAFALADRIYLNGITFLAQDTLFHYLFDKSGNAAILMGGSGDPEIYYQNTRHRFRGIAGATYDYSIDASGITLQNGGAIAYRSKKTDGTQVALAYIDSSNNVIIGGYGSALPCFVGSGGSYFWTEGTLYAGAHIILKNGFSLFAGNAAGTLNYPVIGVASDNRIKINSSGAYNVDAYGAWAFSSTVFNTASSAATGAFHMAPNPSGTAYGSFWYNDGINTYLLLTNNNDALGSYNGLRPFYVNNATGQVIMGHGLNLGSTLQLGGVDFVDFDSLYHKLHDKSGRAAIFLGGTADSENFYDNGVHRFRGVGGVTYDYYIDAGGITLTNSVAYRSRDTAGGLVNLIYIDGSNYVRLGQNGANFIVPDGTFYHSGNVVIPNGTYYYCKINDGVTPYGILGVGPDNRVKMNPNGLGVDASGGWTFGSGLIVNAPIASSGSTAFLQFADRTAGYNWAWYGTGGLVRLWNSSVGDIGPMFDTAGNVFVRNSQGYFGYDNTGNTRQLAAIDTANNSLFASGAQAHTYVYTQAGGYSVYFTNSYFILSNWNAFKPGGGVWADVSERQYKEDIADYTAGLDVITRLRPREFKFNGEGMSARDGRTHRGLIYDEVEDIMPEMTGVYRHRDSEGNVEREYKTLDATSLIYALVNAVKELAGEVDALRARPQ